MRETASPHGRSSSSDEEPFSGSRAPDPVGARIDATGPGLARLVDEARQTWLARGVQAGGSAEGPAWRPFEDAFPSFYQFTNKPR